MFEVGGGGFTDIFDTMSQLECLERLSIGDNSIGCANVEALACLRQHSQYKGVDNTRNKHSLGCQTQKCCTC